ncbi:MAG: hypothetical protein ACR2OU_04360 [Thermomicrobiales bacterium]
MVATMTPLSAQARQADPSLKVVSPAPGQRTTGKDIEVTVEVENFTLDCRKSGRPDEEGVGHIHAMIDGMSMAQLTNFYCDKTFTIPGDGLAPGKHTLIIVLATNTHRDLMETAQKVEIDYQPANPVSLPESNVTGQPGVELVDPSDGATVSPKFTVEVKPVDFEPAEALEGKGNVPGYGHFHVFVDTPMNGMGMMGMSTPMAGMAGTPEGAMGGMQMMSMAGMVAMPGTNSFELDLSAWGPGKHTIWIEPVQNDHTMFEDFGHVEFTVVVNENATPAS